MGFVGILSFYKVFYNPGRKNPSWFSGFIAPNFAGFIDLFNLSGCLKAT